MVSFVFAKKGMQDSKEIPAWRHPNFSDLNPKGGGPPSADSIGISLTHPPIPHGHGNQLDLKNPSPHPPPSRINHSWNPSNHTIGFTVVCQFCVHAIPFDTPGDFSKTVGIISFDGFLLHSTRSVRYTRLVHQRGNCIAVF